MTLLATLFLRTLQLGVVLISALFCPIAAADWSESDNPLVVPPKPADGSQIIQNPPGFSWARATGAQGYELVLRGPNNVEHVWRASRNWFLPDSTLKPGDYTWKVRPANGGPWSIERKFSIAHNAMVFLVPGDEKLLSYIKSRPRPRSLPTGAGGVSKWASDVRARQASTIQALEKVVKAYPPKPYV
jgi:hypothetical protein